MDHRLENMIEHFVRALYRPDRLYGDGLVRVARGREVVQVPQNTHILEMSEFESLRGLVHSRN